MAIAAALSALVPAAALAATSATTKPATKVHHTTAVLNGHLDPGGDPGIVDCHFEWGPTVAYGNVAPCSEGSSFAVPADVTANLSGLEPGATYHFRLDVETTSSGSFQGSDQSFDTRRSSASHPLIASFGSNGTSGGSFGAANMLAVDQARRKLYVFDRSVRRVSGYNISAPPVFPAASGFSSIQLEGNQDFPSAPVAVDSTTALGSSGNVYVASDVSQDFTNSGKLYGFDSSGNPLPGFPIDPTTNPGPPAVKSSGAFITGIAVAANGEIWLSLNDHQAFFLRYSPAGSFLGSTDPAGAINSKLAFDSNGDLYATDSQSIRKYTAASGYTSATVFASQVTAVASVSDLAVDPSTHYLYATTFEGVVVFAPNGERFDEVGGKFFESGVAVDPANHDIYIGRGSKVEVYGSGAPLAPLTATTGPAGPVGGVTATLNGFVDPEGTAVTDCEFEYGNSAGSGKTVPCAVNPGSGSGDVPVSAQLTGLTPGATYHFRLIASNASSTAKGQDETFTTNPAPAVSSPSISNLTYSSVDLEALVNPRGFETTYYFEYGPTSAYGTKVPIPDGHAGSGASDVAVSAHVSGLVTDTLYHWRIVAESFNGQVSLPDQTFISFGPVKAETVGSPIRTATTARLEGRVNPDGAATTFHFEYGDQGPCDANPCTVLPDRPAGSGGAMELVSEPLEGLQPGHTYHYRVIAENPTPGSPSVGKDMTVTTRVSDAALSHGHFPGPPGSDRAYEQVSLPDAGGNPVDSPVAISDDGSRILYRVHGGNPVANTGDAFNQLFAERTANGWKTKDIFPGREDVVGSGWFFSFANADLSSLASVNNNHGVGLSAFYRLSPDAPASKIFQVASTPGDVLAPVVSDDMSRVTVTEQSHVYDLSSGVAEEIDQLPDGTLPACSAIQASNARTPHWLSADGDLAFFLTSGNVCNSEAQLYVRDIDAGVTKLVSTPPVSGPSCRASLIRSTSNAVFFFTNARLAAADTAPGSCGANLDGDVYRYGLGDESLSCVTCVAPGQDADVEGASVPGSVIAIPEDGSRVYFKSPNMLLPGARSGVYRVDVATGDLVYIASGIQVGDDTFFGEAISGDGSTLIFTSASPGLDALGGQQNGGTRQYYRYDDNDRSLTCISCPQGGSVPAAAVNSQLVPDRYFTGPNMTPISEDGKTFAFATPTALVGADQNTTGQGQNPKAGADVYEWRDGRLFLITDGLTNWPAGNSGETQAPEAASVSRSGRDVYFMAAAQYTPDALDGYSRLYDARIGGGFEFPPPPKPCPLEVCQGTPKGAPEEAPPGSASLAGAGNAKHAQAKKTHKKKARGKRRHHKKHRQRRANHKRRAAR